MLGGGGWDGGGCEGGGWKGGGWEGGGYGGMVEEKEDCGRLVLEAWAEASSAAFS